MAIYARQCNCCWARPDRLYNYDNYCRDCILQDLDAVDEKAERVGREADEAAREFYKWVRAGKI